MAESQLDVWVDRLIPTITCVRIDTSMRLVTDRGGLYMATGDYITTEGEQGQRTRLYMNAEAAYRALDRGEIYTSAEYAELIAINHQSLIRHGRGAWHK